jgi:hypothetical protein
MTASNRPRLSVEISPELQARLQKHIPWGLQSHIVRAILEQLATLLEEKPALRDVALAALISGDMTIVDLLRRIKKDGTP